MHETTDTSEARRLLIEARIRGAATRTNRQAVIPRVPRNRPLPLSFAQQRLWFLDQLGAGTAYNSQLVLQLDGRLDRAAVERSVSTVIARHESLRTTFHATEGEPVQVIAPALDVPLETTDLRHLAPAERDIERDRIVAAEYGRAFDLAVGPLVRGCVVQLSDDAAELVLTIHHIVTDAWSMVVLEGELLELYAAFRDGVTPALPDLPIQYPDFAVWQRQRLAGPVLDRLLEHWRERLAGAAMLDLGDRPRPVTIANEGGSARVSLTPAVAEGLTALAREHSATMTMVTLAAFLVLLGRHTNQTDIVIGLPVTGREHSELERLVGFFVNNLPIRVDVSDDPTFIDLLARVKKTTLAAYDHQDLPFERLIQELQPERQGVSNPLFEVVFAMRNVRRSAGGGRDGSTSRVGRRGVAKLPSSRFDLEVHLTHDTDGLNAAFVYRKAVFDHETMELMASQYRTLLESIVADPTQPASRLELLRPDERERLIATGRGAAREYPREATVCDLFEAEAVRRPDAIALAYGEEEVSYRELDERANRLAHRLVALGVGPEVMVGLCVERSIEMVVGILAILKAGGAYVPLDPEYPAQRLAYMARDTRLRVMLTLDRLRPRLPAHDGEVIALDAEWPAIAAEPKTPPARGIGPSSLAYVMYTSGSTGQPKGVCIPHRAIVRLVRDTDYVQLDRNDRVAQAANASFDAATFEIWGPLLTGGQIIGVGRDEALSPQRFAEAIRERRITVLFLTTALFNQLSTEIPDIFAPLRCLLFGGEAVDPGRVRAVLADGAPERLLHVYGPTENTTFSTWHEVTAVADDARTVPIGRPIANSTAYVLDHARRPVPIGAPGELYVGGDGVALGYLNDAGLTADRFVPDPFGDPGRRLYRTGDLVRQRPDGAIEFIGRVDHQVKIRGFRVELEEIETVLVELPEVKAAAVIALEDVNASQRLVAYIVPAHGAAPSGSELRAALSRRLPGYMVPMQYVTLETLPLNANGKVDRAALPAPGDAAREVEYVAPRTTAERALADVWAEVLRVEHVGIHDDFFALGGHSLAATRVVNALRATTGFELSLTTLFERPTIAGLAPSIELDPGDTEARPGDRERVWI